MDPGPIRDQVERCTALLRPARACPPELEALDACLLVLGLARVDPEAGLAYLVRLFEGQWGSGLMPHRVAHHGDSAPPAALAPYRIGPRAHGLGKGIATSSLAAPPALGLALEALAGAGVPLDAELLERAVLWHHWLARARDPGGDGAVMLLHPLESGAPESLRFAPVLERIEGLADGVEPGSAEDPLLPALAQARGETASLPPGHPFRIQDPFATGLLAASNRALVGLARERRMIKDLRRLEALQEALLGAFQGIFRDGCAQDRAGARALPGTLADRAGAALAWGPGRTRPGLDDALDPAGPFSPAKARVPGLRASVPVAHPRFDPARPGRGAAGLLEHLALAVGLAPGDPRRTALRDAVMEAAAGSGPAEHWHLQEAEPVAGCATPRAAALVLVLAGGAGGGPP